MTTEALMAAEVRWYHKNGKYTDRFARDMAGNWFVIGDWDWNRRNPDKQEHIERRMARELDAKP